MSAKTEISHGQLCYLQIPSLDIGKSADFYESVFGWRIDRAYGGFESPGLIGQWVIDRPAAPEAGPLAWFHVNDIDASLDRVRASEGEVLSPPTADGPRWLATVRDPAGNSLGLAQHGNRKIA